MRKYLILVTVIVLAMIGAGCSSTKPEAKDKPKEVKITAAGNKLEKDEYKLKVGDRVAFTIDPKQMDSVEIKGTDIKLDKANPNKEYEAKTAGIFDITAQTQGKILKSKMIIQ